MKDIIVEAIKSLIDLTKWDKTIFEVVCRTACGCGVALLESIE